MIEERTSIGASQATIIYSHSLSELHYWMCFYIPQELQKSKMIKKCCYYLMVPDIMATFAASIMMSKSETIQKSNGSQVVDTQKNRTH